MEDRERAARLTGCHQGPKCRDVWGVGVCGSRDKHHREYERLDDNLLTGSQAMLLQEKPQEED